MILPSGKRSFFIQYVGGHFFFFFCFRLFQIYYFICKTKQWWKLMKKKLIKKFLAKTKNPKNVNFFPWLVVSRNAFTIFQAKYLFFAVSVHTRGEAKSFIQYQVELAWSSRKNFARFVQTQTTYKDHASPERFLQINIFPAKKLKS